MLSTNKKQSMWDDFLRRWPVSRIKKMPYSDYSSSGSHDTFCYWVEFGTKELGGIRGGSAFKFGVYSRTNLTTESKKPHFSYSPTDAWLSSLGSTAKEAFESIRNLVLEVIDAAQKGDLDAIEKNKLSNMFKWKLAFLYQSQEKPIVVNYFTPGALQIFLDVKEQKMSVLNRLLFEKNPDKHVLELGELVTNCEKANSDRISETGQILPPSKNIILYGPPGTGKTYALMNGTVPGLEFLNDFPEDQTTTVTFHPSYGYEDFVETIIPVLNEDRDTNDSIQYTMRDGALKSIAEKAELDKVRIGASIDISNSNIWKMSLGNTATDEGTTIFKYCIDNGEALLGFANCDLSNYQNDRKAFNAHLKTRGEKPPAISMLRQFIIEMDEGDLLFVTKGNVGGIRAIGQVTGSYRYISDPNFKLHYHHARKVNWLWINDTDPISASTLFKKKVSQRTIYSLNGNIKMEQLEQVFFTDKNSQHRNFVLKIDEINRGNVAKIFGELITLIEEDKRNMQIELASGKTFCVPDNLYLIGTMNTADRSLTQLDTALRRRFHFIEMMPDPTVLANQTIGLIDLTELLTNMNERMEALLGREHTLGHAYFMHNGAPVSTTEEFHHVIMNKVLPQLQEYFFDNYQQIQLILGETIIGEKSFNNLPRNFPTNNSYIIKKLNPEELVKAIENEYGFSTEEQEKVSNVA